MTAVWRYLQRPSSTAEILDLPIPSIGESLEGYPELSAVQRKLVSLFTSGCGFGTGGRVDELEARWSAMLCARELPLEPASRDPSFEPDVHVTTEEAAALPLLREAILRRLGLEAPPTGLHGSHFTRWKLLCMLRARAGDVDKACTP